MATPRRLSQLAGRLARLEARHPSPPDPLAAEFERMTTAELDRFLREYQPEPGGPPMVDFDAFTDQQLDEWLAGYASEGN